MIVAKFWLLELRLIETVCLPRRMITFLRCDLVGSLFQCNRMRQRDAKHVVFIEMNVYDVMFMIAKQYLVPTLRFDIHHVPLKIDTS